MQKIWQSDHYYDIARDASKGQVHPGMVRIAEIAQKCHKILEVGCGEGSKLEQIVPKGRKGTGIDISQKAIDRAQQNYPRHSFHIADAQALPFKNNSFDLVYSAFTLEHTNHPEMMITEMVRVLQPNGHLVLLAPNYGSPLRRSPCFRGSRIKKAISGFTEDFFVNLNNSDTLGWHKVEPIKNRDFQIDYDTTVEPYLGSLLRYMYTFAGKIKKKSSCWEISEEDETIINKVMRSLGEAEIYPFCHWGPHLFVIWQKD